jgi:hypothetical protein
MRKLNQRGSFIIWLTLAFALIGTFIGFALDFGRAYLEKARMARLIDSAAIAAAKVLKGQVGFETEATRAACDSMTMNGAKVIMSGNSCTKIDGAPITATVSFIDLPAPGGPPVRAVRVTANQPVPTTFLRFLGWMAPGDYSTINVNVTAEAGPERPVDLMLVLDRSGSMNQLDNNSRKRIISLKNAVNAFLSIEDTFSVNDQIGMVSFASRGCGNPATGYDGTNNSCAPDVVMQPADDGHLTTLRNRVSGLCGGSSNDCEGGTNTMEAVRVARAPLANAFGDPSRATARKAVLLVTDGQPTFMTRNGGSGSSQHCRRNPLNGNSLPDPGDDGNFPSGCKHGVPSWVAGNPAPFMYRQPLSGGGNDDLQRIPGSPSTNADLYRNVIQCTRSLSGCVTDGAMHEANLLRNCGLNNTGCNTNSNHDVIFYAIAIGEVDNNRPQASLDNNAKCLLARMANADDILNVATGVTEKMATVCNGVFTTTVDGDTHADLKVGCPGGVCTVNNAQQIGKVFTIDSNGDVEAQLKVVFNEIAALLKLRLVI